MPQQISNAMLSLMIEAIKTQVGTLEKRMDTYEDAVKANAVTLKQIEGATKFIVGFIKWLKTFAKWCAGILGLIIAGVIVAWLTHLLPH